MSQHDNVIPFSTRWRDGLEFVLNKDGTLKPTSPKNVALFIEHHPDCRALIWYDEFADQIMLDRQTPGNEARGRWPRPMADNDEFEMMAWLNSQGLNPSQSVVSAAIRAHAMKHSRNPLEYWLDGLVWDGRRRIDNWLTYYAGAEDNEYSRLVGRRFLVSAVARALKPGCKVDNMLILEGPQGLKKSSMVEALAGKGWFTDQVGDITSKDASQLVQGVWLIEVSEMDKFSKHESSAVKAFLTRTFDRYRPPYGRNVIQRDRRCVFFGTINPDGSGYLRDVTGNRRYWPVKVKSIDLDGIKSDRDQLWAEARNSYMAGERWWLDDDEVAIVIGEQEDRRDDDPWEPTIEAWLNEIEQRAQSTFVLSDVLWKALGIKNGEQNHSHKLRLSKVLTVLGFERVINFGGIRGRSWRKKQ